MIAKERTEPEHFHLKVVHEISDLINKSVGLNTVLGRVVRKISSSLHYDVVSIYVWDDSREVLRLMANRGFQVKPKSDIFLRSDEGLTGMVHKTKIPLVAMPASKHPNYRYFPEIGEEEYESYIGVPIMLHDVCVGVLVGQNKTPMQITPAEQTLFQIIALRLAGVLEVANTLDRLKPPSMVKHETRSYQGKGVSEGVAVGKAVTFRGLFRQMSTMEMTARTPGIEKRRVRNSIKNISQDLKKTIKKMDSEGKLSKNEVDIFRSHLMIVDSRDMEKGTGELIDEKRVSAEAAVVEYLETQASRFESLPDSYMRERAYDFRDIGERMLRDLTRSKDENISASADGETLILVAREIGVSFVTAVEGEVGGIVLGKGGETSHAVIIAKSLGIPVVVGIDNIVNLIHPGEDMIVDGRSGFIFTNPDQVLKDEYLSMHQKAVELRSFIETEAEKSAGTGLNVEITANVGIPADAEMAKRYGIKRAGLFRTEFAFARFKKWPSVRSQLKIYKEISADFEDGVTIRTLDVGSDKILSYLNMPKEENPLLGLRSIRFSMEYLDLFRDQVKSILLAAKKGGNFKILLPMVSNVWEVETAAQIIEELSAEVSLHRHDIPKLGIMMEVPALVYQFDDYEDLIDFVSVGTNDLIQYLLAVDRNSNAVGHLYSAFHPSVVRMLDFTREQVLSSGKEISICGEIAGVPSGTLLILALGYRHLSVSPLRFPYVKFLSDRLSERMLEEIRSDLLLLSKESDIERYLKDVLNSINPMLLEVE